ncbi:MAG: nucleotidyltransferase domain-containing protein [Polyangiales bacterium]
MARYGAGGLRGAVAAEAARLMYEEGVKQYFTAKRLASKRIFGRVGGRRMRFRPADLPSNGEIRDALLQLAELAEGDGRTRRLFAMRVVALEAMRALEGFEPRLIGSVSTGHIRKGSDVDLHVFTDDPDELLAHVKALGWRFETERVTILKFGEIREYLHVHVKERYDVELTLYERRELRFRPRSSTDGKPIVRVKPAALEALLAAEHTEAWRRYLADGVIEGLGETDDEADEGVHDLGSWEGLLTDDDEPEETECLPSEEELAAESEAYDPLPGFEEM